MEELFEQIIYQAIKKNVSDIHLQCTEKGVIKFRICGELLTYETYEKTNIIQLMNYIRFISKIDLNYYRKPQTGHYVYVLNNKKKIYDSGSQSARPKQTECRSEIVNL